MTVCGGGIVTLLNVKDLTFDLHTCDIDSDVDLACFINRIPLDLLKPISFPLSVKLEIHTEIQAKSIRYIILIMNLHLSIYKYL